MGFGFQQRLEGHWWRADRPPPAPGGEEPPGAPVVFDLEARVDSVRKFLLDATADVVGAIDAPGLAEGQTLRGTLKILPLRRRKLVYELRFPGPATSGELRFHGEAVIDTLHLVEGTTQLHGAFLEEDRELAEVDLTLHLRRSLIQLIRSFRLHD